MTASKSAPRSGEAAPPHESRYHQSRRSSWAARMAARALAAAARLAPKKTEEV